jgi:putative Ca2+/H+ antiporter (TMEM165/GDT1 family)
MRRGRIWWHEANLQVFRRLKRDYYAGALMVLCGLLAAQDARHYAIGTLNQMGPGYFPLALGILLVILGIIIAGTAGSGTDEKDHEQYPHNEWRGWFCIITGPALFIILGKYGGMVPATFACVFVSALGDRETTLKAALILAAGITVSGVILFAYLLKIPMPIFQWGAP